MKMNDKPLCWFHCLNFLMVTHLFKGRGAVSFAMNVAEILRVLKLLSKYNLKRRNEDESFNVWINSLPKYIGGLAVASYGITKGLSLQGDMETIFLYAQA